jgi:hypothetical protein
MLHSYRIFLWHSKIRYGYHDGMPRAAKPDKADVAFDYARSVLRQLMEDRGVNQVQLADVLGIPQSAISDRLRGRTNLTLADLRRLALFFGVSPRVFVLEDLTSVGGSPLPGSPAANAETAMAA